MVISSESFVCSNALCARAKLDDVTPHTLRHTFASVSGDLDFSELTIAGMLVHSTRGVTQRYVHLDKALIVAAGEVAAAIAQLLESARPIVLFGSRLRTTDRLVKKSPQTLSSIRV